MTQLPVFVYGTLRRGCSNYRWLLQGRTRTEDPATVSGLQMYDVGPYPIAVPGRGKIRGDLIRIGPALYRDVLHGLDELEGFNPTDPAGSLYVRRSMLVATRGGRRRAWVYLASPRAFDVHRDPHIELVPSGDWKKHRNTITHAP